MILKSAPLEAWRPVSSADCDAVRLELERVLASQQFCNSKRYPALLRFVVEKTLMGRAEELKERTLGIEVFQRPPDYDTNADTVVRYTAGEVRKRLSLYYHDHEPGDGVQISLPAGSYVPEFHRETPEEAAAEAVTAAPIVRVRTVISPSLAVEPVGPVREPALTRAGGQNRRIPWLLAAVMVVLLAIAGFGWRFVTHRSTPLDAFWAPMFQGHKEALLCSGANVFANNNYSGTETAGKDIDYPFVSIQIVSSVSRVSGIMERGGLTYKVQAASATPLTDMRDRPIVLFGAYNNVWSTRLLNPLRFHFSERPNFQIVDREHPEELLSRDRGSSSSYGNSDDYAIVARFRDTTTGSIVLVLAGLGRNGTEAATQFATSEESMRMLQQKIGGNKLANGNIEVVLKASVIGGRTGEPSIQNVYVW
ncbi:hypothetical protein SAMN05421771_1639 [Granulicella pectinivorans]|uniref:Uncharacterized protein n=1 Tax=Granulicella pectinivorans TaxID=474950 RepID=A0A1I6M131_9BACT|nr:hypothetical protein [Granulicella pectinivorans]SFS09410.1 hypothetical protein SAMN05421771_1639 [Granulicella pectinivorans]